MDITACRLGWYFLLDIWFLCFFYSTWGCDWCFYNISFGNRSWSLNHSHQLLPFLFIFLFLLIDLFLLFCTPLRFMLRLTLIKITIKFISTWATFNIIFFIIIAIIKISKIFLPLLHPKWILFLLFFAVDEVSHLGASSLPKLHVSDGIICWVYFGSGRWVLVFIISLIIIWISLIIIWIWGLVILIGLMRILIIMWWILLIQLLIFFIKLLFVWFCLFFYSSSTSSINWRKVIYLLTHVINVILL
jgi:hypothetical protein